MVVTRVIRRPQKAMACDMCRHICNAAWNTSISMSLAEDLVKAAANAEAASKRPLHGTFIPDNCPRC